MIRGFLLLLIHIYAQQFLDFLSLLLQEGVIFGCPFSTVALMKPEMSDTKFGVSVDISTSYLSAARVNDELLLIGRVVKEGTSVSVIFIDKRN